MQYKADTPDEYLSHLSEERKLVVSKIRDVLRKSLPEGFIECINYNMIGFVVPHNIYPNGYHVDPKLPLPFINLASQKNYIALYHMGLYADKKILGWLVSEYPKHSKHKLDMGKSCIRFKYMDDIPYDLISQLCTKMSSHDWISLYENNIAKEKK